VPRVECPVCHLPATLGAGKPYCPHCGWNRDAAERQLRQSIRIWPGTASIFILVMFILWGVFLRNWRLAFFLGAVLAVPLVVVYLLLRINLGRFLAAAPDASGVQVGLTTQALRTESVVDSATAASPTGDARQDFEVLASLPKPRPVRLSKQGRLAFVLPLFVVLTGEVIFVFKLHAAWILAGTIPGAIGRERLVTVLAVLLPLILAAQWRAMARERDLVANGTVANARVVSQWRSRNGYSIEYEFQDSSGTSQRKITFDYSRRLQVGMTVPVFYDAQKQVAQCTALHEAVLPWQDPYGR
jgi:hypothetical protein